MITNAPGDDDATAEALLRLAERTPMVEQRLLGVLREIEEGALTLTEVPKALQRRAWFRALRQAHQRELLIALSGIVRPSRVRQQVDRAQRLSGR